MKYIDLNMVRAYVVPHPADWEWCGYRELIGLRKRYCILDMKEVLARFDSYSNTEFRLNYKGIIQEAIDNRKFEHDPVWTQSIAVGRKSFVDEIKVRTENRREFEIENDSADRWIIREPSISYE